MTAGDDAAVGGPARPVRPGRRVRVLSSVVVAVLLVALGVSLLLLSLSNASHHRTAAAKAAAQKAAQTDFVKVLSYSYKTLDQDLAASRELTTGQFRTYFDALVSQEIKPQAPAQQTVTKATATPGGVVDGDAHSVDVLLFIDQTTTGTGSTASKLSTSTVEVTMQKVGSRWLIANVVLVPASSSTGSTTAPSTGSSTAPSTTTSPSTSATR